MRAWYRAGRMRTAVAAIASLTVLAVASPAEAWSHVAAGRSWGDAEVVRALGARGVEVV